MAFDLKIVFLPWNPVCVMCYQKHCMLKLNYKVSACGEDHLCTVHHVQSCAGLPRESEDVAESAAVQ